MTLNIGLLIDATKLRAWELWMLERIHGADATQIALIVLDDTPKSEQPTRTWAKKVFDPPRDLLWSKYRDWDYRRQRTIHDAFKWVDASEFLATIPQHRTVPLKPKPYEFRFDNEARTAVADANIDVMLRLGFGIVRGEMLDEPRHGTWSFHRGDNRRFRGNPGLFWEIHDGDPASGTVLQRLTDSLDGGHVLYRSSAATNFDSYQLSRNPIQWKTAQFVERTLALLADGGWDAVVTSPRYEAPEPHGPKPRRNPSNSQMLKYLARRGLRQVAKKVRSSSHARPLVVDGRFTWNGTDYVASTSSAGIVIHDSEAMARVSIVTSDETRSSEPVAVVHDDVIWIFATRAVDGASLDDELHIFHSTSPDGPWLSHPMNPVISDAAAARPAGPIAEADGTLTRIVWDAISAMPVTYRIDQLSATDFRQTRNS